MSDTKKATEKIPVLVYGSLRKGEYNFHSFNSEFDIDYIKTGKIKGYELHSLGSYPGIIPTDNKDYELTVDLLYVEPQCKYAFDRMELGAGYRIEKVEFEDQMIDIYVHNHTDYIKGRPLVESGDWVQYLKERRA